MITIEKWSWRVALVVGLACFGSSARAATITWTNTSGGSWKTALNWSPNKVPGSADSVIISADGSYTVTVNANASVGNLALGGGTATPKLAITAGTFKTATNGVTTVLGGSLLDLAGGILDGEGRVEVAGTLNWSKGEVRSLVHVAQEGRLNLSANNLKLLNGGVLDNEGMIVWSGGGGLELGERSSITNRGVFEVQNDVAMTQTLYTSRPEFINLGTFRKTTASGVTTFDVVEFRNSGTIELQTGDLGLPSDKHKLSDGTRIIGPGSVLISGAEVTLSGTVTAETPLELNAGTLKGTFNLVGDLNWRGGSVNSGATVTGTLNMLGGTSSSSLTVHGAVNLASGELGGGPFTLNGNLTWTGGTISSTKTTFNGNLEWSGGVLAGNLLVQAGRTLTVIDGSLKQLISATLTNQGTVRLEAAEGIKCDNGSMVYNYGSVLLPSNTPFTAGVTTPSRFYNYGSLIKTGAGQLTWAAIELHNRATVEVQQGILALGTRAHSLGDNSAVTGAGGLQMLSGSVALGTNVSCASPLEILDGTLTASGSFNGNIVWTKGSLAGVLTIPANRQLHLTGSETKTFAKDSVLNLAGEGLLDGTGDLLFFANATINNTGTFEIQTDGNFTFNGSDKAWFYNAGTLRKTVATASLPFSALQLINTGILDLQSGDLLMTGFSQSLQNGSKIMGTGSVRVNGATLTLGGTVTSDNPVYLASGGLAGTATLVGPLTASGGLLSGVMTVNGPVVWSAGELSGALTGKQTMVWTGGTVSGTLAISPNASLTVKSGGTRLLTGVLNNAGAVTVEPGGFITVVSGTPFVNSGLFEVQDDVPFKLSGSSKPVFNNSGTFRKTGSTRTLPLSFLLLQNSGTLDVQAGGVDFTLNNHTFGSGSRLIGSGPVRIAGATVTMNAALQVESPFELASGFLLGDATIEGNLKQSGGQLPGLVTVSRDFTWSGGEVNGTLTASNRITWSGGWLSGTLNVPASCQFDLQDGATKLLTGTLNNYGTLSLLLLSQVQLDSGCVINNAGLCQTWAQDPFAHVNGGVATFNNTGTFRKLGPQETTINLNVIFQNSGILEVVSNSLAFISGTHTFSSGSRLIGAGLTRVAGATVNWNGAITNTGPIELASGSLVIAGSMNGIVSWSGGTMRGLLSIPAATELRLVGVASKTLQAITVTNLGFMLLEGQGALQFSDEAIIQNYGLFELQNVNSFTVPNNGKKSFNNFGTLRKRNSTQPFVFSGVLLQNTGTLDIQAGSIDFTLNSHSLDVGSHITGSGPLRVNGATVTLAGEIPCSSLLELAAGTLLGTATLNGPLKWSGGTISGVLTNTGNVNWTGGLLSGTLALNSTMDWSGGTVSGSLVVPAASQLTVSGSTTKLLTGTLQNFGQTTIVDPAMIQVVSGTPVVNSGSLELQSDLPFKVNGTAKPVFSNTGSLRRTVSNKAVDFGAMLFQNSGTLNFQTSELTFSANSHSFADGSRTFGPGGVRVSGGTLNMNGTATLGAPFTVGNGVLAGNATLNGAITIAGGSVPGSFVLNGTGSWTGGELDGTLVVNGQVDWEGGLLSGSLSVPATARANVLPGGNKSISGVLQNAGLMVVSNSASIQLLAGTPLVNSGVIEVQGEQPFKANGTTKVNFINSGTLRKTTSNKLMKLDYVLLQNSGILDMQAGELSLALNDHYFADGTRITGSGAVRVAGATLNIAGDIILGPPLALDSGVLAGNAKLIGPFQFGGGELPDRLIVNGQLTWTGGLLKGGLSLLGAAAWTGGQLEGWLCIATNSALSIGGSNLKNIKGGTLTNLGLVTVSAPVTIQADGGAVIENFGEVNLPASLNVTTPWGGKPTFNNYGGLSLTNGFGLFNFPGKLLQFPSGQLEFELAGRDAGTNFSQIRGVVDLGLEGGLNVRTLAGFEPMLGDRLEIIQCADRVGTFATYTANTPRLSPDYSLTNVTLFAAAPSLTSQPVSKTVSDGAPVSFEASAYGSQPLTYQWFWNGSSLPGATNTTLTFTNVHANREGQYAIVVTNIWGSITSTLASLVVILPPSITQQPQSLTVLQGEDAVFTVAASGTHLRYRWKFGDSWMAGATNATLVVTDAGAANGGKYKVEVSNLGGAVMSAEAILAVIIPPTITENPVSKNVNLGSSVTLTVRVTGTEPFSYQWLKNGLPVPSVNQASLVIDRMTGALQGTYEVIVANPAGYAISVPAVLLVNAAPQITAQPVSQTVAPGAIVSFSVTANGVPAPTYQWRLNGVTLLGASQATLVLTNVQPRHSGDYSVVVANSQGSAQSVPAILQVVTPPIPFANNFADRGLIYTTNGFGSGTNCGATKQLGEPNHVGKGSATNSVWISWWAPANGIATFSTLGSDFDTVLAVYRGTNVNTLSKIAADDDDAGFHCSKVSFNAAAGTYYQIAVAGVGGTCGEIVLGWDLIITSELLPQITQAPLDVTGNTNDTVALQVVFDAFEPTGIQWFFQGQTIGGATNSIFSITGLQEDKVGGYAVRLTGASGRTVVSPPGDIQINTEGASNVSARNKFFDAFERAFTP